MYKITITKEEKYTTTEKVWHTKEKLKSMGLKVEDPEDTGGYVNTEVDKIRQINLLEQTVEVLDFPAVIKAINQL